jgi:hypothetical protein
MANTLSEYPPANNFLMESLRRWNHLPVSPMQEMQVIVLVAFVQTQEVVPRWFLSCHYGLLSAILKAMLDQTLLSSDCWASYVSADNADQCAQVQCKKSLAWFNIWFFFCQRLQSISRGSAGERWGSLMASELDGVTVQTSAVSYMFFFSDIV